MEKEIYIIWKTPSEYRNEMKDQPFLFADLGLNATAAGQCSAALPTFHVLDPNDVIDHLLNRNARRFGYDAISIKWNGSCVLTDRDLETHGFRLNKCINTMMLPEYKNRPENRWLYQFCLNEILKMDYIPFEDTQFGKTAKENGGFSATDIGYEIVNTCYLLTL